MQLDYDRTNRKRALQKIPKKCHQQTKILGYIALIYRLIQCTSKKCMKYWDTLKMKRVV